MKQHRTEVIPHRILVAIVASFIVVMPFHAFLTVWLSSGIGHYTALRLWKEVLLAAAVLLAVYLAFRTNSLWRQVTHDWLWRLSALYILVTIVWGLIAYASGGVTTKALLYGELINIRPFLILFVAWVAASGTVWLYRYWLRLVVVPAVGVVAIALLQRFVLPHDVLKHFGYSDQTISPYQTIDHKVEYLRVRSTLRGANLLGAYLIVVIPLLVQQMGAAVWRRWQYVVLLVASLIALFVSGSRGAWIGTVVAVALLVWMQVSSARLRRLMLFGGAGAVLVLAGTLVILRDNDFVQNTFFHTDEYSRSAVSSNDAHVEAAVTAISQVATEPLGRGPGTAGPASVYNSEGGGRIAENYFLQIGQETGWLGLALIVGLFVLLAHNLWLRRQLALARVLLAALAGLTVMALLMHIWTDDTIVYLWFSLTGIALAQPVTRAPKHAKTT